MNALDNLVFLGKKEKNAEESNSPIDKNMFSDVLEIMSNVFTEFISRERFNNKNGDFLIKVGENKYKLFLPDNLKAFEVPGIIKKVNDVNSGKNIPKYSSIYELNIKMSLAIDFIKSIPHIGDDIKKELIQGYINTYSDLFGEEKLDLESKKIDECKSYQANLIKIGTIENINNMKLEINNSLG